MKYRQLFDKKSCACCNGIWSYGDKIAGFFRIVILQGHITLPYFCLGVIQQLHEPKFTQSTQAESTLRES